MIPVTPAAFSGHVCEYQEAQDMLAWLNCLFRGYHTPERQFVGGFRCVECGRAGADLEEMGFENFGYAPSLRRAMVRREVFRG